MSCGYNKAIVSMLNISRTCKNSLLLHLCLQSVVGSRKGAVTTTSLGENKATILANMHLARQRVG